MRVRLKRLTKIYFLELQLFQDTKPSNRTLGLVLHAILVRAIWRVFHLRPTSPFDRSKNFKSSRANHGDCLEALPGRGRLPMKLYKQVRAATSK